MQFADTSILSIHTSLHLKASCCTSTQQWKLINISSEIDLQEWLLKKKNVDGYLRFIGFVNM